MNTGNEDFEKLQKLLKLKRYEQPPPGYFNRFSGVVVNRLESKTGSNDAFAEAAWLKRLLGLFESSPVAAVLFGSAACAVVIFAIALANTPDAQPPSVFATAKSQTTESAVNASLATFNADAPSAKSDQSTDPIFGANLATSTPGGSMTARIEPVSFTQPPQ